MLPTIPSGNVASATADTQACSCRFNDDDTAFLDNYTPSSADAGSWTFSFWVKRGKITPSASQKILSAGDGSGNRTEMYFQTNDKFGIFSYFSSTTKASIETVAVFRDPTAWYNFVLRWTGSALTIWVNGTEVSQTVSTAMASGSHKIGADIEHRIGIQHDSTDQMFDGYLAEVVLVTGSALAATSFGEFDSASPTIWKPKDAGDIKALTFGQGFYLDFKDSANLGNDVAGSNNFTVNNLAATDQATDTPTNNFCILNPLDNYYNASTFSEGNLQIATHASNEAYNTGTIGVTSGKWYWEVKISASQDREFIGISDRPAGASDFTAWTDANGSVAYYSNSGDYRKGSDGSNTSYGDSHGVNDIVGIALDVDNMKLYFSKNGTWQNSGDPTSGSTGTGAISLNTPIVGDGFLYPAVGEIYTGSSTFQLNFGGCPPYAISSGNADANGYGNFEYAVPSGYYALCTKNLAEFGG